MKSLYSAPLIVGLQVRTILRTKDFNEIVMYLVVLSITETTIYLRYYPEPSL